MVIHGREKSVIDQICQVILNAAFTPNELSPDISLPLIGKDDNRSYMQSHHNPGKTDVSGLSRAKLNQRPVECRRLNYGTRPFGLLSLK